MFVSGKVLVYFFVFLGVVLGLLLFFVILLLSDLVGQVNNLQHNMGAVGGCSFDDINALFVKAHKNVSEDYNCVDYSKDYEEVMKHLGFDVSIQGGHNSTEGHMWNKVCMDIEPQTGEIVNYKDRFSETYSSEEKDKFLKYE